MTYRVSRTRGNEETTAESTEARAAVRILNAWSVDFPQQHLVIRDEQGIPVAYRRAHAGLPPSLGTVPQYLSL